MSGSGYWLQDYLHDDYFPEDYFPEVYDPDPQVGVRRLVGVLHTPTVQATFTNKVSYFHAHYWPVDYWHDDYWQDLLQNVGNASVRKLVVVLQSPVVTAAQLQNPGWWHSKYFQQGWWHEGYWQDWAFAQSDQTVTAGIRAVVKLHAPTIQASPYEAIDPGYWTEWYWPHSYFEADVWAEFGSGTSAFLDVVTHRSQTVLQTPVIQTVTNILGLIQNTVVVQHSARGATDAVVDAGLTVEISLHEALPVLDKSVQAPLLLPVLVLKSPFVAISNDQIVGVPEQVIVLGQPAQSFRANTTYNATLSNSVASQFTLTVTTEAQMAVDLRQVVGVLKSVTPSASFTVVQGKQSAQIVIQPAGTAQSWTETQDLRRVLAVLKTPFVSVPGDIYLTQSLRTAQAVLKSVFVETNVEVSLNESVVVALQSPVPSTTWTHSVGMQTGVFTIQSPIAKIQAGGRRSLTRRHYRRRRGR